jgi:hypothetical protein
LREKYFGVAGYPWLIKLAGTARSTVLLDLDDLTAQKTWFLLATQGENCVSTPWGTPSLCAASRRQIISARMLYQSNPDLEVTH